MKHAFLAISLCLLVFAGVVPQALGFLNMNLEELQTLAKTGDADAQTKLGVAYSTGAGVGQDKVEAVKWYRLAADQGYANGQWNLAFMYVRGEGVKEDMVEARRLFKLAADQGYPPAEFDLGVMYLNGYGGDRNRVEALNWVRKSADHGYKEAVEFLKQRGEK